MESNKLNDLQVNSNSTQTNIPPAQPCPHQEYSEEIFRLKEKCKALEAILEIKTKNYQQCQQMNLSE